MAINQTAPILDVDQLSPPGHNPNHNPNYSHNFRKKTQHTALATCVVVDLCASDSEESSALLRTKRYSTPSQSIPASAHACASAKRRRSTLNPLDVV